MKKILFAVLFAWVGSAQAILFEGSSSGVFINPTGGSGMVTTGVGTDSFTWGTAMNSGGPSSLDYTGSSFSVNENQHFVFGSLDYFNGTLYNGTEATSVDLSVELGFTTPAGLIEDFIFDLGLINTPNTSDPNASADYVTFDNSVSPAFFNVGGIGYTLEFLGFGTLTGGGFTLADNFHVLEGQSATVDLVGRITSTPGQVPVPATILLLGLGALGMRVSMRKQKRVV